ncbi:GNAT family N-acetyltransferase, partial [bacterium]|nr:GNAT family N-acetyltransferase [bacterium]
MWCWSHYECGRRSRKRIAQSAAISTRASCSRAPQPGGETGTCGAGRGDLSPHQQTATPELCDAAPQHRLDSRTAGRKWPGPPARPPARPTCDVCGGIVSPTVSRTLIDLGLSVEQETAIMVYALADADRIDAIKPRPMPDGVSLRFVDDQEGIGMWWYVWRNAHYEVLTHGVEPIYIGLDVRAITLGQQYDLVLSRFGFPIGVARITLNDQTAHLTSLAIMQEFRATDLTRLLIHTALTTAKERGCSLVFTTGDGDEERRFYREIGFVDFGSIVCYSELGGSLREESRDLAQPVFALTNTEHVLDALRQTLRRAGLSLYRSVRGADRPGYAVAWRGFVAAPAAGWTRIIVEKPFMAVRRPTLSSLTSGPLGAGLGWNSSRSMPQWIRRTRSFRNQVARSTVSTPNKDEATEAYSARGKTPAAVTRPKATASNPPISASTPNCP